MIYSTTTNSVLLLLVPAFLAATGVDALNDWKVPCTKGSCSYDLPASADAASGTLKIWGSDNAITDITTAAGWQILGCSPTALNQSIRLVCMDDPADPASQCAHLYQNVGAVNKIVRLPEDCGSSAFARISSAWTPSDQSIPSSIRRRLVRRDGTPPTVKALALDTDFDKVDWSKTGVVNIAILGANVPGAPTEIDTGASSSSTDSTPATRRRSAQLARDPHLAVRGFLGSITDGIKNAGDAVKDAASKAAGAVKDTATKAADAVKDEATKAAGAVKDEATKVAGAVKDTATKAADKVADAGDAVKDEATKAAGAVKDEATKAAGAVKDEATKAAGEVADAAKDAATKIATVAQAIATKVATAAVVVATDAAEAAKDIASNKIDVSKNFTLPPINFNKNINLINSAVSCAGKSLSLQADMQAQATAQISLSVAAIGTIVPPDMKSFGVIAGMTASVSGTMTMTADVSGRIDSGKLTLFNLGIPGFSFPGILTVGPSFSVEAQLVGDVDLEMDVEVGIVYNVNNAQIAFPPDAKTAPDQSAFQAGDTPLTLNAAPSVSATGTITAHLIPSINLGVEALGGKAEAKVFLALDANAALNMNLDAGITKDATVDGSASDNSTDTTTDAAPPAVEDGGNSTTITNVDQEGGDTEVFQNPDGSLVDQFGNNVTDTGDLVDPTSAVNANGELLNGGGNGTSADVGITNVADEKGDTTVFQNPDGSLVDQFGNPVTDTGDLVDPTTAVDADGNLLNPGPDDAAAAAGGAGNNSTSTLLGITNVVDETGDQTVFQNPDGTLVDQFGNNVTDVGDLIDPTTAVDASGNPLNPGAAGIKNVADEQGDQTVFANPDGSLVDQFGNPVTEEGDLVDPGTAVDAEGNFLNGGADEGASAEDAGGEDASAAPPPADNASADDASADDATADDATADDAAADDTTADDTTADDAATDDATADASSNSTTAAGSDDTAAAASNSTSTLLTITNVVDEDGDTTVFQNPDGTLVDQFGNNVTDTGDLVDPTTAVDATGNPLNPGAAGIKNVADEKGDQTVFQNPDGSLVDQFGNPVTEAGDLVDPTTAVDKEGNFLNAPADASAADAAPADDSTAEADADASNNSTIAPRADDNSTETTTTKTFGGCISVTGNVNLKAGVVGSFFGLFDQVQSKPFFNKDFKIFNKCFGSDAAGATAADNSTATPIVDDGSEDIFDDGNGGFVDANGTPVDESGLPLDGSAPAAADNAAAAPVVDDGSEDIFDDGNGGFEDAAGNAVDDTGLPLATRRRRFTRTEPPVARSLERRINLTCPVGVGNKKSSITKGTVKAGSVTSEAPKTT